jgi:hypothetical protein
LIANEPKCCSQASSIILVTSLEFENKTTIMTVEDKDDGNIQSGPKVKSVAIIGAGASGRLTLPLNSTIWRERFEHC